MKHHELVGSLVLLLVIGILMLIGYLYFNHTQQMNSGYTVGSCDRDAESQYPY
jgi:hypothetical protein